LCRTTYGSTVVQCRAVHTLSQLFITYTVLWKQYTSRAVQQRYIALEHHNTVEYHRENLLDFASMQRCTYAEHMYMIFATYLFMQLYTTWMYCSAHRNVALGGILWLMYLSLQGLWGTMTIHCYCCGLAFTVVLCMIQHILISCITQEYDVLVTSTEV
jgi:hypothetical protein